MKRNAGEKTKVIELLDLVWHNANQGTEHSWERLNHSMWGALALAIGSGIEFNEGDFNSIATGGYRYDRWIGDPEWCYTMAVTVGNLSAIRSYETWQGRGSFIADDVELPQYGPGRGYMHGASSRQRERLAVGFWFMWKGERAKVTAFKGDTVLACSYKTNPNGSMRDDSKVLHRFRITREDILTDRAERKERKALLDALNASGQQAGNMTAIAHSLGVPTSHATLADIPIEKLRSVAKEYNAIPAKEKRRERKVSGHRN